MLREGSPPPSYQASCVTYNMSFSVPSCEASHWRVCYKKVLSFLFFFINAKKKKNSSHVPTIVVHLTVNAKTKTK